MFHTHEYEIIKTETIPVDYYSNRVIDMELYKCKHCDSYSQEEVSEIYERNTS